MSQTKESTIEFLGMRHATCPRCQRWEFHRVERAEQTEQWTCQGCGEVWSQSAKEKPECSR